MQPFSLDARFQQFMPNQKKDEAIEFLIQLHKKVERIEHLSASENNDVSEITPTEENRELEFFLSTMYGVDGGDNTINERSAEQNTGDLELKEISVCLRNFIGAKQPLDTSVFDYWEKKSSLIRKFINWRR